jgi:ABC-type branched-subunit amino acid transport system permease subunit
MRHIRGAVIAVIGGVILWVLVERFELHGPDELPLVFGLGLLVIGLLFVAYVIWRWD